MKSEQAQISDKHKNLIIITTKQNKINFKNITFLPSNHLGQIAHDTQTLKFYTIEKQVGDKGYASHIYQEELFDGSVLIFNEVNAAFVILDEEFCCGKIPREFKKDKTEEESEDKNQDQESLKFTDVDQFKIPFNNEKILERISEDIFDKKEVDIGFLGGFLFVLFRHFKFMSFYSREVVNF